MRDCGGQGSLVAETLGLAMARRAAEILQRHREMLGLIGGGADGLGSVDGPGGAGGPRGAYGPDEAHGPDGADVGDGVTGAGLADRGLDRGGFDRGGLTPDPEQFAADEAVFSTVLDAVNECMGRFDARPASDRWCDALFQLLQLAESSAGA
jgi:hypothetical protein